MAIYLQDPMAGLTPVSGSEAGAQNHLGFQARAVNTEFTSQVDLMYGLAGSTMVAGTWCVADDDLARFRPISGTYNRGVVGIAASDMTVNQYAWFIVRGKTRAIADSGLTAQADIYQSSVTGSVVGVAGTAKLLGARCVVAESGGSAVFMLHYPYAQPAETPEISNSDLVSAATAKYALGTRRMIRGQAGSSDFVEAIYGQATEAISIRQWARCDAHHAAFSLLDGTSNGGALGVALHTMNIGHYGWFAVHGTVAGDVEAGYLSTTTEVHLYASATPGVVSLDSYNTPIIGARPVEDVEAFPAVLFRITYPHVDSRAQEKDRLNPADLTPVGSPKYAIADRKYYTNSWSEVVVVYGQAGEAMSAGDWAVCNAASGAFYQIKPVTNGGMLGITQADIANGEYGWFAVHGVVAGAGDSATIPENVAIYCSTSVNGAVTEDGGGDGSGAPILGARPVIKSGLVPTGQNLFWLNFPLVDTRLRDTGRIEGRDIAPSNAAKWAIGDCKQHFGERGNLLLLYGKAGEAIANGNWSVCNSSTGAFFEIGASTNGGLLAVAMTSMSIGQYGWFVIRGIVPGTGETTDMTENVHLYVSTITAGAVSETTSGSAVMGARTIVKDASVPTGQNLFWLNHPFVDSRVFDDQVKIAQIDAPLDLAWDAAWTLLPGVTAAINPRNRSVKISFLVRGSDGYADNTSSDEPGYAHFRIMRNDVEVYRTAAVRGTAPISALEVDAHEVVGVYHDTIPASAIVTFKVQYATSPPPVVATGGTDQPFRISAAHIELQPY